ncbi:MAG: flavin reductase family protein [Clostridia bacterium]|nr:flavin reductase family protein [Clostridia bacterium]
MRLSEADFNFTEKIGKGALLTATDIDGRINTMTVSWGGAGVLWGKEVAFVFVRPERHTFGFCENGSAMTLSFFDSSAKDILTYCGTKSGRDVDKFKECNLKYTMVDGMCVYENAIATLCLEKIYADDIKKECFFTDAPMSFYNGGGFHKMFVCHIRDVICK